MANLEEIWYLFIYARLDDAATALIDPVALGTGVSLPVYHFENEGLKSFGFAVQSNELFPVGIVPPEEVLVKKELAVFPQYIVGKCPNFFVDAASCRFSGQ